MTTPSETPGGEIPGETPAETAVPDALIEALPEDPALAAAVLEIEAHVARDGWDQPARLYALVDTA